MCEMESLLVAVYHDKKTNENYLTKFGENLKSSADKKIIDEFERTTEA